MANEDRPRGFEVRGEPRRANEYVASEEIMPGELVKMTADGKVARVAASEAACGSAMGYADADGKTIMVADDPDQEFICQASGAEIDNQDDINLNYDVLATAGDSTYKVARMELDSSTGAPTATLPLKLRAIDKRDDNELGANVDCVVTINNHQLKGGTGTAGV